MRSILAIGNTIIDQIITVDALPLDGKVYVLDAKVFVGGQGGNAAETMAHLGLNVSFVTRLGDDINGAVASERYQSVGISLEHALTVQGAASATAYVIVSRSSGQRSILMRFDRSLTEPALTIAPQVVRRHDVLYLDGYEIAAAVQAARVANDAGIPVISDFEVISPETLELLPLVDVLIAPADVIRKLGGEADLVNDLRGLRQRYGRLRVLVATQGEDGSTGIDGSGAVAHVPAERCTVVDTTGAGDAYHAGYVRAFCEGRSMADAMRYAASVATVKCQCLGPRSFREHLVALQSNSPANITNVEHGAYEVTAPLQHGVRPVS